MISIKLIQISSKHYKFLYNLLAERKPYENISHKNLLIGETFQKNIDQTSGLWVIKTPEGNLNVIRTNGGKATFEKTYTPGVYSIFELPYEKTGKTITKLPIGSKPAGTFTVNIDTQESSPQKISEKFIKTFLPNLEIIIKNPELNASKLSSSEKTLLATPLLLLVAGIFLIEGWMVRNE